VCRRRRERYAVIGVNRRGQPKLPKRAVERREGEFLPRGGQRLAGQQVEAGEVGDRRRVAVAPVAEHELALVVGAPQRIRFGQPRERRGGRGAASPAPPPLHQMVAIQYGVDGADRRQLHPRDLLPQFLADLGGAPRGILALQADNGGLDGDRQTDSPDGRVGGCDR
jgi:hypothetical protein